MSNIVNYNLIQKYLYVNADKIYALVNTGSIAPIIDNQTKIINKQTIKHNNNNK